MFFTPAAGRRIFRFRFGVMALVVSASACNSGTINEPAPVSATVFGMALVNGLPATGYAVQVLGASADCQRRVAVGGSGIVDSDGKFRIAISGATLEHRICVRVGMASSGGLDTTWAVGSVEARKHIPLDSVRVDIALREGQ